jgi:hypothetical protein
MASNIADLLVVISLIAIVSFSFISSLPIIYMNRNYFEDYAIINAIEILNNAIQSVYNNPESSVSVNIYLPTGSWIIVENDTIKWSKSISVQVYDPNKIIIQIGNVFLKYKILFNNFIINKNINKLIIKCINYNKIIIKEMV